MNKRQKEVQQLFLDNEKKVLKELERNYRDALAEINGKIEMLMGRNDADLAHVIYRIEHQKALRAQIEAILESLHTNEFATVSEFLAKSYEDGFIGTMYDMHGQGVPLVLPIDQKQVVEAIQHETKLKARLYTEMGHDIKKLQEKIAEEISRGISTGQSTGEMARNLASYAKIPQNRALTIARTESHRIQCHATSDAQHKAKEKGADVLKQWDAALDGDTRDTHRRLDGQIRELDEPFEVAGQSAMYPGGFGDPAEDCNCRCALLQRARWALGEEELDTLKERAEYFGLDKTKDFEDFKEKYMQASERVRVSEQKTDEGTSQEKAKIDFTPAKSIEEAQEAAKQYIGSGYSKTFKNEADFKGVSLDNANEVNRAITELYAQYDMPKINGIKAISPTSAQGKKVFSDADAVAAYSPIEHGIFLNKDVLKNANALEAYNKQADEAWDTVMKNLDKLSDSQKEIALTYKNAGRSLVGDGSVQDYITHEMGHHVQWEVLDSATNNAMGKNMSKYAPDISGYANASKGEYIAESFVAYTKGEIDKLDPVFVDYMKASEKVQKVSKTLENTGKSGIIKLELQTFAEKDIKRQESNSLKRAMRKYDAKISLHEDKIQNPESHIPNWNQLDSRQQEGLKKHWQKEINNFRQSISDRVDELKERGDYDE